MPLIALFRHIYNEITFLINVTLLCDDIGESFAYKWLTFPKSFSYKHFLALILHLAIPTEFPII